MNLVDASDTGIIAPSLETGFGAPAGNLAQKLAEATLWLYAFLTPIAAIPLGSQMLGASDVLWPLALLLLLCHGLNAWRMHHLWMALFLLCAFVSLLQIHDGRLAVDSTLRWFRLAMLTLPLFCSPRFDAGRHSVRRALQAYFWGGLIGVLSGIVVYWLQIPMHAEQQQLWLGPGVPPIYRAGGLMGNTAGFGHLVATWTVVQIATWKFLPERPPAAWLRMLLLSVAAYAVLVSSSRAALVHLTAASLVVWLSPAGTAAPGRLKCFAWKLCLLSGLAIAVAGGVSLLIKLAPDEPFIRASLDRFLPGRNVDLDSLMSGRWRSWQMYAGQMEDHLWLGAGYRSVRENDAHPIDNSVLSIAYETGLLGLICAGGFLASVWRRGWQLSSGGDPFAWLICVVWFGQVLHALTADIHSIWLTMPGIYLLTGLILQPLPGSFARQPEGRP